jgi:hypothetical protein
MQFLLFFWVLVGGDILNIDGTIVASILGLAGSAVGSLCGVLINTKLSNYRIEQLEKKVDKHNNFSDRIPVIEEQVKVINHRIDDLENYHK